MESFKKYSSGPVGDFEIIPIKAFRVQMFLGDGSGCQGAEPLLGVGIRDQLG